MQKNRVVAVDPGYDRVGIAVMEKNTLLFSECFVPPKGEFSMRLEKVFLRVTEILKEYNPNALAIETLFFSKNQKTAIAVAEARGVITVCGALLGVEVFEYSPQAVKIAVTGSGNATKDGVIRMVEKLVVMEKRKRLDDEFDAIALAVAHTARSRYPRA